MLLRHACGISGLVKLPKRLDTWMDAFPAAEHLSSDSGMGNTAILDHGSRNGDGAFGIVRSLADSPLVLCIAHVSGDGRARRSLKTANAVRIPVDHLIARQHLRLFTDGIAGGDAL